MSSGNLPLAKVPSDFIKNITKDSRVTGNVGYVYYKVTAPTYTTVAGNNRTPNNAWIVTEANGAVDFRFNTTTATNSAITFTSADNGTDFQYAGNGAYTATFYTTRTDNGNIYVAKTSTITVKNTQEEVKYLGLNPEYNGIFDSKGVGVTEGDYAAIIKQQLMFSFDEAFLGEFFDEVNGWENSTIKLQVELDTSDWNTTNNKVTLSADGTVLTVSRLTFKVKIYKMELVKDTNNNITGYNLTDSYDYISIVPVGARIRIK